MLARVLAARNCGSSLSPCEEGGGHGRPGDAAGSGLLALLLLLLLLAAAAEAAQVDGHAQQVEAQAGRRHAAQEDQGLWTEDTGWGGRPRFIQDTSQNRPGRLARPQGNMRNTQETLRRLKVELSPANIRCFSL